MTRAQNKSGTYDARYVNVGVRECECVCSNTANTANANANVTDNGI